MICFFMSLCYSRIENFFFPQSKILLRNVLPQHGRECRAKLILTHTQIASQDPSQRAPYATRHLVGHSDTLFSSFLTEMMVSGQILHAIFLSSFAMVINSFKVLLCPFFHEGLGTWIGRLCMVYEKTVF